MAGNGKRSRQPLTLMIVPGSAARPISVRIPVWLFPLALALIVAAGLGFVSLVGNQRRLERQVEELRRERQAQEIRQQEMRATILDQQGEAQELSAEVEQFRQDLDDIEHLSSEIREIVGLEKPISGSTVTTTSVSAPQTSTGTGGQTAPPFLSRGPAPRRRMIADESHQQVRALRFRLPALWRQLQELRLEVVKRVAKIAPTKRRDSAQWAAAQRLLAAAPTRWPVDGAHNITSFFGYRTFKEKRDFHTGIDIGVWYSTEVRATKDGKVVVAGWAPGYGWTVEIEHEMGYRTLYAHNRFYMVDVGDEVKEGDVIALSGGSGNTTGPHLHYEIRLNNKPVDPLRYLDW